MIDKIVFGGKIKTILTSKGDPANFLSPSLRLCVFAPLR